MLWELNDGGRAKNKYHGAGIGGAGATNAAAAGTKLRATAGENDTTKNNELRQLDKNQYVKLSEEQKLELRRTGRCFRCKERGHLSIDCPAANKSANVARMKR